MWQEHKLFFISLILFLLLGLVYIKQVPPFEGPDEGQHFAYILWLAAGNGFPPQDETAWDTPIEQEASQPPFYYLLASIPARFIDTDNPPAPYRPNPYFVGPFPRTLPDNDNRAIHYPSDVSSLSGGWLAFYLARLISLGFGVLLLVSVYGIARQVTPWSKGIPLGTVFLVALTPQFVFISSVASNDMPAAALSTLTLWFLARYVRRGGSRWLALALGLSYGLALMTKISAALLIVPIGLGWLWVWYAHGRQTSTAILNGLILGGSALLVSGWWFVRSLWLYGTPLGLGTHYLAPWAISDPAEVADFIPRWLEVFRSYWLAYGWGTIRPNGWVYNLLGVAAVLAVIGIALAAWRWRQQPRQTLQEKTTVVLLGILAAGLLMVMIFLEYWQQQVNAPYGRLLYPAITAVALFLIIGWRAIHPRLPVIICGLVGVMALLGPFTTMRAAYLPPDLLSEAEVADLSPTMGVFFGPTPKEPVAELLRVQPVETSVQAGNLLAVEICWRALTQTEDEVAVLLHIVGPENGVLISRRTYPGLGHYPTTIWQPGAVFCDLVRARVWKTLSTTMVYKVEVAMYDEGRDQRLPAFNADGGQLTHTFFDDIRLVAFETPEPVELQPEAGQIQLLDYEVAADWQSGEAASLQLNWGVAVPVSQDLQTFVHLRDRQTGELVAQADGPPMAGWYPTSWWEAGEEIVDQRSFPVPAEIPAGTYDLVVGFYDLASSQRVGQEYFLPPVEVEPAS